MLSIENLCFDYPGTHALHDVCLSVEAHSITALVGPNGAGKTTLLRCIAGLADPIAGRVLLRGRDVHDDPREAHKAMGYLSDFFGLYDELTVAQCLRHAAGAQGVPADRQAELAERAARRTGIAERLGQKAGALSRGLRQRLAIAQAILHEPRLLLLDEPASGLDPEARQSLSNLFLQLRDEGMTLIVSSHILSELRDYSTHLLILKQGKVEFFGPVEVGGAEGRVAVTLEFASPDQRIADFLGAETGVTLLSADATSARIVLPEAPETRRALLGRLIAAGLPVSAFNVERADLQDAYLSHLRDRNRDWGSDAA